MNSEWDPYVCSHIAMLMGGARTVWSSHFRLGRQARYVWPCEWLPLDHLRSQCTGDGLLQRIQPTRGESCNSRYHPLCCPHSPEVSKFHQGTFLCLKQVSIQGMQLPELSCPPLLGCSVLFLTTKHRIFFSELLAQLHNLLHNFSQLTEPVSNLQNMGDISNKYSLQWSCPWVKTVVWVQKRLHWYTLTKPGDWHLSFRAFTYSRKRQKELCAVFQATQCISR